MGHSLGSKLHILLGSSRYAMLPRRRANVLISFNNFSAKQSVPLLDEMKKLGEAVGVVKGLDLTSKVSRFMYLFSEGTSTGGLLASLVTISPFPPCVAAG